MCMYRMRIMPFYGDDFAEKITILITREKTVRHTHVCEEVKFVIDLSKDKIKENRSLRKNTRKYRINILLLWEIKQIVFRNKTVI